MEGPANRLVPDFLLDPNFKALRRDLVAVDLKPARIQVEVVFKALEVESRILEAVDLTNQKFLARQGFRDPVPILKAQLVATEVSQALLDSQVQTHPVTNRRKLDHQIQIRLTSHRRILLLPLRRQLFRRPIQTSRLEHSL